MPKSKDVELKKQVLALTKEKAILTIEGRKFICSIAFYPEENIFILTSRAGVIEMSLEDGLSLLKGKLFKDLHLVNEEEVTALSSVLAGKIVAFADTDYTAILDFCQNELVFTAEFGTLNEKINLEEARTLLETGSLPNLTLMD